VQGVKLELLISPLLTLTVLLLAFVLVQVFNSYRVSRDAASLEAGRILFEEEVSGYYDEKTARPMQEVLTCYSFACNSRLSISIPATRGRSRSIPRTSRSPTGCS
jgi:hypothetical protein